MFFKQKLPKYMHILLKRRITDQAVSIDLARSLNIFLVLTQRLKKPRSLLCLKLDLNAPRSSW